MDTVDLPIVTERPPVENPGKGELVIIPYVNYLITHLVLSSPSELMAEAPRGAHSVTWFLRNLSTFEERVFDELKSILFRPVLARIGFNYMSGAVYGGYRRFQLRAGSAIYTVAFYLGNDSLNGLWFRARCGVNVLNERAC